MRNLIIAILALFALAACAPAVSTTEEVPTVTIEETPELLGPTWRLVSITDAGGATIMPASGDYTLEFTGEGRANARLHCNSGGSNFETTAAGGISFGPMMSTLMFCGEDSIAHDFGQALEGVTAYNFTGGDLFLTAPDGTVVHMAADEK